MIIFAARFKKSGSSSKKREYFSGSFYKKNFAEIKWSRNFATRLKNRLARRESDDAERSLKVWKQQHSDILDIGGKF